MSAKEALEAIPTNMNGGIDWNTFRDDPLADWICEHQDTIREALQLLALEEDKKVAVVPPEVTEEMSLQGLSALVNAMLKHYKEHEDKNDPDYKGIKEMQEYSTVRSSAETDGVYKAFIGAAPKWQEFVGGE